jgi:hypothetical protein
MNIGEVWEIFFIHKKKAIFAFLEHLHNGIKKNNLAAA